MLRKLSFAPREMLFGEGEVGSDAYFITSGAVLLTARENGEHVRLATLGEGDLIDEAALVEPRPREATATALSTVEVIAMGRDDLAGRLDSSDPLLGLLLQVVLRRLRDGYASVFPLHEAGGVEQASGSDLHQRRTREALRSAIGDGQLELVYQPLLDTRLGSVAGFEALLRWQHPDHGTLPAAQFIRAVDRSVLIYDLGLWAVQQACRDLPRLAGAGPDAPFVTVNLAPSQVLSKAHCDDIIAAVTEAGPPAGRLRLEVAEPMLLESPGLARHMLRRLMGAGLAIALDDVGSSTTSLRLMAELPIDMIKLDRQRVRHLGRDDSTDRLLAASVAAAHSMDMQVVAEGVEDAEALRDVTDLGCDLAQGYGIAPGLPLTVAASFAAGRKARA